MSIFNPFDNQSKAFFESGFIDGFNMQPDQKQTALRQGLLYYYQTYHALRGSFYHYLEKYPNGKVALSQARGHDFLIRYFSSISFVQLFIELHIKEVLEMIDPILINGQLNSSDERNFINWITNNDLTRFTVSTDKTVPFSVSLSRLNKLIAAHQSVPHRFRVPQKFHIYLDNADMLAHLAGVRNSIIHKADKVMAKYSFEVLFVNYVLPFVRAILRLEKRETFIERNLTCNINVLDELSKIKLPLDYNDATKFNETQKNLRHINHLKELGRASYHNQLAMGEELTAEQLASIEQSYNRGIRLFHERDAELKQNEFAFHKIYFCPCCGTKSLMTYDAWDILAIRKTQVQSAACYACTYDINHEIGEPKEFNLMDQELFVYLN